MVTPLTFAFSHISSLAVCFRDKLTAAEFAKAEKVFHESVAIALGSDVHQILVLQRLRERLLHHDSDDSWTKAFHRCKYSRLYLNALCRPLASAHSVKAPKRAKVEEKLCIVADCITHILAHGSSSFEQFVLECPSEFCNMALLIAEQWSVENVPSLAAFCRALASCSSEPCVKFMISTFHSWYSVMINLMKKKEDCINGLIMQVLCRLSSREKYCKKLVASSELVEISNCVVSAATCPRLSRVTI